LIKTALVGVGNCASALVQGLSYCRNAETVVGLPFPVLGGYRPEDIEIVAAFDIDARKVGLPLTQAIFAPPNCAEVFYRAVDPSTVIVARGPTLDGLAAHMCDQPAAQSFVESDTSALSGAEVVAMLRASGCEVMVNFLPVGAAKATAFYADCALEAGLAFVNAIPVFLASDPAWGARFAARGLPILGDDFKSQIGATILHRDLADLFGLRGAELDQTYQLNIGGNTDFLNMMDGARLDTKRHSKTEAVQAAVRNRLEPQNIRIGPSDHVPWLKDRKVAYVHLEGRLFGGAAVEIELRLSVADSPNAAAMALTAIRCARIALDRGLSGPIWQPSAFLFKHPPRNLEDRAGYAALVEFAGNGPPDT
jgi:myo-inositol-1-phosphate synthase